MAGVGWIEVAGSDDVAPGRVVAVEVGDRRLALWRTEGGTVVACDARCPHQWSDLGEVGEVDGEELVCVSHHWRFDTAGRGSKLSMAGRRDPKSDVGTLAVRERDGAIAVEVGGTTDPARVR